MTALKVGTVDPGKVYNWDEDVDSPSEPLQATTTYQSNDTIRVATTVEMEFDDSSEAALLRKCDEADRLGVIHECHPQVKKI